MRDCYLGAVDLVESGFAPQPPRRRRAEGPPYIPGVVHGSRLRWVFVGTETVCHEPSSVFPWGRAPGRRGPAAR